jgi:hypothetical protein
MLDELLVPGPATSGRTRHAWLRDRPSAVNARALRRELEKRVFLIEQVGADRLDLAGLSPNRRAWLAQTGSRQIRRSPGWRQSGATRC